VAESSGVMKKTSAKYFPKLAPAIQRRAFTLVELLVVIGVIAMLVGLLIVGINAAQKRAQKMNTQFLLSSISQALSRFKSDHGYYPPVLGDPSELTTSPSQLGWPTTASATPKTQIGFARDLMAPPINTLDTSSSNTKVSQWKSDEATALQNWYSVTSLAEYLIGAGDRSQDGYGICGELPDTVPTNLLPGQRELPRAGIRSPGMDGVWGAALQPISMADANSATVTSSYSGAKMPSNGNQATLMKGLFFSRNLALPSRVLLNATVSGAGNDTSRCILRSRPNLEGKIFGPYLELKDPSVIGGYKGKIPDPKDPAGVGKIQSIVRVTDGDPDFDKYPKVILDYWGQPIRYYRKGYVNLTPNTPDQATDGTKFDLGDFFALRPTQAIESEFIPDAQAATDVLADENNDRSSTARLRSAEFALLSSGPDKKLERKRRIGIDITPSPKFNYQNPNNDVDLNADNIVETGP
jgi:prepilin-type N-terminal cleavage/methylation domain-containing protein